MFVWECIKSEGTHVGVCVDSFMFGSCCVHNTTVNTISASHHHQQQHNSPTGTFKPALPQTESAANGTTRLPSTSLSSFSWISTAKPSVYQFSESHSSTGSSTRPMKPFSHGARPLQKRPHAKPTSEHDVNRQQTPAVSSSTWVESRPQGTKRPGNHHESHQKIRPENTVSERPVPVQSQPGFKDKETHNTLIVRLPGKEHADDKVIESNKSNKPGKPGKPNSQRPSESRPDDSKDTDLNVQETINRPNVNSVIENVRKRILVFHF